MYGGGGGTSLVPSFSDLFQHTREIREAGDKARGGRGGEGLRVGVEWSVY